MKKNKELRITNFDFTLVLKKVMFGFRKESNYEFLNF